MGHYFNGESRAHAASFKTTEAKDLNNNGSDKKGETERVREKKKKDIN